MIPYTKWTNVPLSTRIKIAEQFNIPKVRSTHVFNDVVQDDGYNVKDMENALTVPAMQAYLNSTETDLMILFQQTVDKIEGNFIEEPAQAISAWVVPEEVLEFAKQSPSVLASTKKVTKRVVKKKK